MLPFSIIIYFVGVKMTRPGAVLCAVALTAGLLAGCGQSVTTPPTTTPLASTGGAPICLASQLVIGGLGGSAAAGTGVTTIRIHNQSNKACRLRGYPTLVFLSSTGARIATTSGHSGPGAAFRAPATVILPPRTGAAAGFVILSGDFPTNSETSCPVATSLRVRLPRLLGSFIVDLAVPGMNLCRPGRPVDISPIVPGAELSSYAPQNLTPSS